MVETPINKNQLPDIHPGIPGYHQVYINLCVRDTTPSAVLVELPELPSRGVWLCRKHVSIGRRVSYTKRERTESNPRIHFDVCDIGLPVWLYRKIKESF